MFLMKRLGADDLAAELLRRQERSGETSRLALIRRWRDARFRRDLASVPVEPLIHALTRERIKQAATS